jgi:hypothetical protein
MAAIVRLTPRVQADRVDVVDGREAQVHRFALGSLAQVDDDHARRVTRYIRDHRVGGMTVSVSTDAEDGGLLRLRVTNRQMTTCIPPTMYCQSWLEYRDTDEVVPKPVVPPEDQVYWRTSVASRHGRP